MIVLYIYLAGFVICNLLYTYLTYWRNDPLEMGGGGFGHFGCFVLSLVWFVTLPIFLFDPNYIFKLPYYVLRLIFGDPTK